MWPSHSKSASIPRQHRVCVLAVAACLPACGGGGEELSATASESHRQPLSVAVQPAAPIAQPSAAIDTTPTYDSLSGMLSLTGVPVNIEGGRTCYDASLRTLSTAPTYRLEVTSATARSCANPLPAWGGFDAATGLLTLTGLRVVMGADSRCFNVELTQRAAPTLQFELTGARAMPCDDPSAQFTMAQTLSDGAQRTTLAFAGLALLTGNLEAQSFFPPGKVADYTGFQYLRDNDPDNMGHNTSFLTRIANNLLFILKDEQLAKLKALAAAQLPLSNEYGLRRFALMKAFRRLADGDLPLGSPGLNLAAVQTASRELYLLDGQIAFDRAVLYADILRSLDATQLAYLAAMKGKGWSSWPDVTDAQVRNKLQGLPAGTAVAVMTYASDLYSWWAGSLAADVYFCPERHGTYFGSFYIKDAPAIGHEGYSIDEQLTATAGAVLVDAGLGYVNPTQAQLMSSLVDRQRGHLYGTPGANIVEVRTEIATLLRSLQDPRTSPQTVQARVQELSARYGDLDGANNHAYATVFAAVKNSLSAEQKTKLTALRKTILSGRYADGTAFDFSGAATAYLYAEPIKDSTVLVPYLANNDRFFAAP
ncbi:hypothetical protein [Inhella gelatinilytica]|uniref:Uncharacterized protein n=1 Tax=Inhella gelatinilytica TaxID=2795030 RepID=A0A931IW15_9BURK|nr:hypothetical protein [Inhella gelatinilytica]MBH9553852.1 hypothetical protein [Inhella gelatinilytica]